MASNVDLRDIGVRDEAELMRRQYLQLVHPDDLSVPAVAALRLPEVQTLIYNTMFAELAHVHMPPKHYQYRVLKRLISRLEHAILDPEEDVGFSLSRLYNSILFLLPSRPVSTLLYLAADLTIFHSSQEISNDLATSLAHLLAQPPMSEIDSVQQKSYVTYTAPIALSNPEAPAITLLEARSVLASSGNTGVRTWEAALRLGTYLCSEEGRKFIKGKAVLELGAGTGLLSILCAKQLQARYVLATDGSGEVVDVLRSNITLNGPEGGSLIHTTVLQWGHANDCRALSSAGNDQQYDLILAADIVRYPFLVIFRRNLPVLFQRRTC